MKIKDIVSKIAKQEGKTHEASVGDVREIVGIVSDMIYKDACIYWTLTGNGERRAKRKKKK